MGIKAGTQMGLILNDFLNKVMNEELENDSEILEKYVRDVYCE